MMKPIIMRYGIFLFFLACGLFVLWLNIQSRPAENNPKQKTTPTVIPFITPVIKTTVLNNQTYAYAIIGPINSENISLHSNLPEKISSGELKNSLSCQALTSAGFYGTNNRHIGLFVADDIVIQEQSQNYLFNSYVWATKNNTAGIGQLLPDEPLAFALQTGPLLISDGIPRKLTLTVDEQARRLAVGVTQQQSLFFYVVYKQDNIFTGPTLVNLPDIIKTINDQEQITTPTVVNLDGGNHSTFQSQDANLLELQPVGGIFCIK